QRRRSDSSKSNSSDSRHRHPRFSRAACRTSASLAKFGLVPGAFLYEQCSDGAAVEPVRRDGAASHAPLEHSSRSWGSWYLARSAQKTQRSTDRAAFSSARNLYTDSEPRGDSMCETCGRTALASDKPHRQPQDSGSAPPKSSNPLLIAAPNPPKALQEPPFDPLYFYHHGSRQEILREISGVFPRLRARLRRALKGSYQKRPWTIDDVFALATWVIMSQAMLLLIGTTTTVSVFLWTLNRLQYQDWIAHKLSDWVSSALGVTVSFESAIVPAWRRGAIRLKN
ncbi:Mitochondrial distribution and morphology protein 31, mitochondrial precursor, partial [Coemansia sp. RSA 1836]